MVEKQADTIVELEHVKRKEERAYDEAMEHACGSGCFGKENGRLHCRTRYDLAKEVLRLLSIVNNQRPSSP